ncbi:MAG TPA: choice-of-anchor D domain-containing protein, partial [Rubrivivax sp.]|nr:choice-of-anchor D domain-containing protein [Rubrivivax sp.]
LTNNGRISADVAGGTLAINAPGNYGSLQGSGTLQVAGGTLALNAGAAQQGQLVIGAAGTLVLPSNLTLSGDYTNVQAFSGNSFDRRAGVSGAGQILAGGDVKQAITGANVTNGNTANATLTINNVRVGSNTFNYQVGNAGTTGPTLRGAIQTAVNGGNLSDARLSGSGVTAANYNAGGPGANSGNLSVVFNAASAGVLAPLSSQVLNLRSNFDNIADQKLAIVLAGGAAAYNTAVGAATPTPVTIANQRVGGSAGQTLTVANTAAAGNYSEDLRASFGASSGAATHNGGIANQVVAGTSDSSAMKVGVDTSSAGAKSGTVTLNYQTTGT